MGFLSIQSDEISLSRVSGEILGSKSGGSNLDLKFGASLHEFGFRICLGPSHPVQSMISSHHVPPLLRVCGVIHSDRASSNSVSPSRSLQDRAWFSSDRDSQFPTAPVRINPRSRDLARVIFVPTLSPPRSKSPSPSSPQIWQGTFCGDVRSFAQVLASPQDGSSIWSEAISGQAIPSAQLLWATP
jgi:hypothetical protein